MRIKDAEVLKEFRGRGNCELCGLPCLDRESHHIITRGAGGSDHRLNLVALGGAWDCACHYRQHYSGGQRQKALFEIVARREQTTVEEIEVYLWLIRALPKNAPVPAFGSNVTQPCTP